MKNYYLLMAFVFAVLTEIALVNLIFFCDSQDEVFASAYLVVVFALAVFYCNYQKSKY